MIQKFNERELEEMEALSHYIKYVLSDSQIEDWKVWDCIKKLEGIGKKMIERNVQDKEMPPYLKLDEMKELIQKLFSIIRNHLAKTDNLMGPEKI